MSQPCDVCDMIRAGKWMQKHFPGELGEWFEGEQDYLGLGVLTFLATRHRRAGRTPSHAIYTCDKHHELMEQIQREIQKKDAAGIS